MTTDNVLIDVKNLEKSFGDFKALNGITTSIKHASTSPSARRG